uniref:E3 ubiquitin/ISG15 ligase TRIM25-like n=1 Tax=Pristiophorus japonicus TaxID=55135 RepID=UPI00398F32DD
MAASSCFKEELACPICLDLLCDPVTTNCGHNFCSRCIEEVWVEAGSLNQRIQCPQCRQIYTEKPLLKRNTLVSNLIDQLTKEPEVFSGNRDDVPCDWCFETILKAEKTCLTCMASYCLAHLRPHTQNAAYQDHEVTSPITDLQEWKCKEHRKIQDVFCTKHSTFVCAFCEAKHCYCKTTSLEEQCKQKKMDLQRILGMLPEEIKVAEGKLDALADEQRSAKETASKMKILIGERFKEAKKFLIMKEESIRKAIDEDYLAVETKIEADSRELLEQIEEFNKTKSRIEPVAKEKDQWRFLKAASSIPNQVERLPSPGEAVDVYIRRLQIRCNSNLKLITQLQSQLDNLWQEIFKYGEACALTFEPKTAHMQVILSDRNMKMLRAASSQPYDHNPERFTHHPQVLCSQSFSKGCHYWDIGTKNSLGWAIGIAYKSIKISDRLCHSEKAWCVQRSKYSLSAWHNGNEKNLGEMNPHTVRVCLDFSRRSVSFYSVAGSVTLLHKYNVAFTEPVYPACWLIDTTVNNALVLETPH